MSEMKATRKQDSNNILDVNRWNKKQNHVFHLYLKYQKWLMLVKELEWRRFSLALQVSIDVSLDKHVVDLIDFTLIFCYHNDVWGTYKYFLGKYHLKKNKSAHFKKEIKMSR